MVIYWLMVLTMLKNMKVNRKDDIPYMKWKIKILFETNQFLVSYTIGFFWVMFTNLANHSQSWVVYDIVLPPGKLTQLWKITMFNG